MCSCSQNAKTYAQKLEVVRTSCVSNMRFVLYVESQWEVTCMRTWFVSVASQSALVAAQVYGKLARADGKHRGDQEQYAFQ